MIPDQAGHVEGRRPAVIGRRAIGRPRGDLTRDNAYCTSDADFARQQWFCVTEAVVKSALFAGVTILLMGLGTAGAASYVDQADRSASAQAVAARSKRPRVVRPLVATLPAAEEELPTLPPPPKVKPAPRIKDTRELSRMSRRQA